MKNSLSLGTAAAGLSLIQSCDAFKSYAGPKLLSARTDIAGSNYVGAYTPEGEALFEISISSRAHSIANSPVKPSQFVFFSRRPGTLLHHLDIASAEYLSTVEAAPGRHFYGHGCFSADGQWLYTTENDYENSLGVVSVRNARTFRVEEEFPSYGIGPHELRLMPDQKTLVVANGGIITHPSMPREKLNLDDMQPSLVYIDTATGKLAGEYRWEHSRLGIRHIDVNTEGQVVIATQLELATDTFSEDPLPLVATHQGEDDIQLFPKEAYDWSRLQSYCGSVTLAKGGGASNSIGVVTSPRGGRLAVFDFSSQQLLAEFAARDVCGVGYSLADKGFYATSGDGSVFFMDVSQPEISFRRVAPVSSFNWDNHLIIG